MKVQVESAEPHWDERRRAWTLECSTRGAFRSKTVLTKKEWKALIPQLSGSIRHSPRSERDARFAAFTVNALAEQGRRIAIEASQNVNVRNWSYRERGEDKPSREERKTMAEAEKRKVQVKGTLELGDLSFGQAEWQLRRLGDALKEGIVPDDRDAMEVLIGLKRKGSEQRTRKVRQRKEDGTEETVIQTYDHPIFESLTAKFGPNRDELPNPDLKDGFTFSDEVRNIFRKAKGKTGRPFEVNVKENEVELYLAPGIDVLEAKPYVEHLVGLMPWFAERKGAEVQAKAITG